MSMNRFNPFMPAVAIIYISNKSNILKYLKESCSSRLYLQLSFKYFANFGFIQKLFSKVPQVQTTYIFRQDWV